MVICMPFASSCPLINLLHAGTLRLTSWEATGLLTGETTSSFRTSSSSLCIKPKKEIDQHKFSLCFLPKAISKLFSTYFCIIGLATPSNCFCCSSYSSLEASCDSSSHLMASSTAFWRDSLSEASSFPPTFSSWRVLRRL